MASTSCPMHRVGVCNPPQGLCNTGRGPPGRLQSHWDVLQPGRAARLQQSPVTGKPREEVLL